MVGLFLFFNIITLLFTWSWLRTIATKPTTCSNKFILNATEWNLYNSILQPSKKNEYLQNIVQQRQLTVVMRMFSNERSDDIRICRKTQAIKPDRAHYDSMTKGLVLKMDHYCPWVSNCIGYSNYKFFILFLFYAILYCFTIIGIALKPFLACWSYKSKSDEFSDEMDQLVNEGNFKLQTILVSLVSSVFSISITCLFFFHCYLVSKNRSTIEVYGDPILKNVGARKNLFDVGLIANWRQVFGNNIFTALLPVVYDDHELDRGQKFPLNEMYQRDCLIEPV